MLKHYCWKGSVTVAVKPYTTIKIEFVASVEEWEICKNEEAVWNKEFNVIGRVVFNNERLNRFLKKENLLPSRDVFYSNDFIIELGSNNNSCSQDSNFHL